MTPDEKLKRDIAEYLAKGGTIQQVDSSANADANTRFRDTVNGPRYVDKALAEKRKPISNSKKRGS